MDVPSTAPKLPLNSKHLQTGITYYHNLVNVKFMTDDDEGDLMRASHKSLMGMIERIEKNLVCVQSIHASILLIPGVEVVR